jgi:DNA repair exonuclease SbcCD ATPase subunit
VAIDYYLDRPADRLRLKLEVLQNSEVIRTYSNKKQKGFKSWPGGPSKPQILPSKKGYNRFTWDFKREELPAIHKVFIFGGLSGSNVAPGNYTLRLTLEEDSVETVVTILANPSVKSTPEDFRTQQEMLVAIENTIRDMHASVNQMRSAKKQLDAYAKLLKDNDSAAPLIKKGEALTERINRWEEHLIQADQKTFQDVINFNNKLNAQLIQLKSYVDQADPSLTNGATKRFNDLIKDWKVYQDERDAIIETEMNAYNALYKSLDIPALILDDKKK